MSRPIGPPRPQNIEGFWNLVRRVPLAYAHLEPRKLVRLSTRIRVADDPRAVRAKEAVEALDRELQAYWQDLKAGKNPDRRKSLTWATETAQRFGFPYLDQDALATAPLVAVLERIEALMRLPAEQRREVRPALLGEIEVPKEKCIKVKEMLSTYEEIIGASLMRKADWQLVRWRNPRQTALDVFTKLVGPEKAVHDLTHDDGFALRTHWNKRVLAGEVQIDTANKHIGYVAAMFREIRDHKQLKMEDVFHRKTIKGHVEKQREAFGISHVQDVLLAQGALDKLNDEARAIFYLVAELGLRPSEACGLTKACIHLDHVIPYIEIKEDGRELKTQHSIRNMPLVGVALAVMKHFPEGFPRYRGKNDQLSAVVNKHLRTNGLLQTDEQSFYSLRHTFKDRLRKTSAREEFIDMLMGHSTGKEKYGLGYELEEKQRILNEMAFTPPPLVFAPKRKPQRFQRT